MAELDVEVQAKCSSLQDGVAADEAAHLARISAAERQLSVLASSMQALEARGDTLSNFAGRVGSRLQTVDSHRRRAIRGAEALQHLAAFAHSEDLSSLPAVYHDEDRTEEAAVLASQLSIAVTNVLYDTNDAMPGERRDHGRGNSTPRRKPAPGPPTPGTLAAAAEQLELYRNVLDNRVVSRFDTAAAVQDFGEMANCARVMAAAGPHGDALLISRYISNRPVFLQPQIGQQSPMGGAGSSLFMSDSPGSKNHSGSNTTPGSLSGGVGGGNSTTPLASSITPIIGSTSSPDAFAPATDAAAVAAMRSLTDLFSRLSSALHNEAVVMEQVFPDPPKAVATLAQRMFEQVIQTALESALAPPPIDAPPEVLRSHLRLLAEAYRKTFALAEEAAELAGPGAGLIPSELADSACGTALVRYLSVELAWLSGLGTEKLKNAQRTLSKELILDFLSMNEEAVRRCIQITPAGTAAPAIRLLFHSSSDAPTTPAGKSPAPPACLLGQAAAHMLLGLGGAADRCVRRLVGPFRPDPGLDKDSVAQGDAAASLGTLLQAIAQISDLSRMLKQHYDRVIVPHVANSPTEAAACAEGLTQLFSALDKRTAAALERTISQIYRRVAATLSAEQLRSDFRPDDYTVAPLDTPTPACLSAVAVIRAIGEQASAHLHGSNLSSFLTAFSLRAASTVEAHALKFVFSPEGAVRWRRDLAEFASCFSVLGARAAGPAFEDLYSVAGLLIVPPESLSGLLEGVGHLDKRRVKLIAALREDWKTAKVGDKPLAALFPV